jgi:hypothetical protein
LQYLEKLDRVLVLHANNSASIILEGKFDKAFRDSSAYGELAGEAAERQKFRTNNTLPDLDTPQTES